MQIHGNRNLEVTENGRIAERKVKEIHEAQLDAVRLHLPMQNAGERSRQIKMR
jgi:pyruvate formate-lyase activating enzyme-like uncharacterized protein